MFTRRKASESGTTAVEMLVCLAVMLQMLLLASNFMKRSSDRWQTSLAANHLVLVSTAAGHYVQDHLTEYLNSLNSPKAYVELDLSKLQSLGYLPSNFVNQNIFQQSIKVRLDALEPGSSDGESESNPDALKMLRILTYTLGGQTLSDTAARAIADTVGGQGGYLPNPKVSGAEGDAPDLGSAPELIGSCKGWSLEVPEIEDLQPGHTVMLAFVNEVDVLSAENFLRRVRVINNGTYNVMQTDLGIKAQSRIQFLPAGQNEVDPDDEDATSIQSKELRLGKGAYWNEKEGLVLENEVCKLQIQPESIVLTEKKTNGDSLELTPGQVLCSSPRYNETAKLSSISGMELIERSNWSFKAKFGSLEMNSNDSKLTMSPTELRMVKNNQKETVLGIDIFYLYDSASSALLKYDPLLQLYLPHLAAIQGGGAGAYGFPHEPQFIVRSADGGRRWFGVGFNATETFQAYENNDRIEFVDLANRKSFAVGLSGVGAYKNSMPCYSNKPHFYNILDFVWSDSPYVYLGNDHGSGESGSPGGYPSELLITASSCVHNTWFGDKSQDWWGIMLPTRSH